MTSTTTSAQPSLPTSGLPLLLQGPKGVFILFDYGASFLAVFVNLLVLTSVIRAHINLTGYKYFLVSLGLSDLYLCIVNISVFVTQGILQHYDDDNKCWSHISRSLQIVGFMANLLNLCGMSVDHLVGIVYPLKYNRLMSKRVLRTMIGLIWLSALLIGSADIPVTSYMFSSYTHSRMAASKSGSSSLGVGEGNSTANCSAASQASPTFSMSDDAAFADSNYFFEMMNSVGIDFTDGSLTSSLSQDYLGKETTTSKPAPRQGRTRRSAARSKHSTTTTPKPIAGKSHSQRIGNRKGVVVKQPALPTTTHSTNFVTSTLMKSFMEAADDSSDGAGSAGGMFLPFDSSIPANYGCFMKRFFTALESFQPEDTQRSWCSFYNTNNWLEWAVMTSTVSCFVFLAICYGKIFNGVFFQGGDGPRKNARKLVMTTFLLLGAFIACWLPFMIFEISMILALQLKFAIAHTSPSFLIIHNIFNSLLLSAPLVDPLIYAARLSIVRKEILAQFSRNLPRLMPCFRKFLHKNPTLLKWRRSSAFTVPTYDTAARSMCSTRRSTLTVPLTPGANDVVYGCHHISLLPAPSVVSSTVTSTETATTRNSAE